MIVFSVLRHGPAHTRELSSKRTQRITAVRTLNQPSVHVALRVRDATFNQALLPRVAITQLLLPWPPTRYVKIIPLPCPLQTGLAGLAGSVNH